MELSSEERRKIYDEEKARIELVEESVGEKQTGGITFYQESDLLFRRFSFFLLSTSFLVVAFVSLVTLDDRLPTQLVWLSHAIAALASLLSFAFFVINYMSAKVMQLKSTEAGSGQTKEASIDKKIEPVKWLHDSPIDIVNFIINPLTFSKRSWAAHTWFIPLVFCLFWVAAWWIVLSWYAPIAFSITILLVSLFYIFTGRYDWKIGRKKTEKKADKNQ